MIAGENWKKHLGQNMKKRKLGRGLKLLCFRTRLRKPVRTVLIMSKTVLKL